MEVQKMKGHALTLALAAAIGLSGAALPMACKAGPKPPPDRMPVETARMIESANLKQQLLNMQIEELNRQVRKAAEAIAPRIVERDAAIKQYQIGAEDSINYETGEIRRAAKPSPDGGAPKTDGGSK